MSSPCSRFLFALPVFALVLLLTSCQSRWIYYPRPYGEEHRQHLISHYGVQLPYETSQGKQVAHYIPPTRGQKADPKVIWLCFGGNGTVALDWLKYVESWDQENAYLLIDYPGYGDSEGSANPTRIREASKAAVQVMTEHLKQSPEQIQPRLRIMAHSIGCAAGLMAANDLEINKIILIAPFTSMTDMGKIFLGWPLCYINMHRFDNRYELTKATERGAQVVIFHGTQDKVIPITMSQELAAAHPRHVTLHQREGWDHNLILRGVSGEIGATMKDM